MVEKKKPSHKESQNPKAKSQKPKAEQKQKSRTNAEQNRTKAEQKQNKSRIYDGALSVQGGTGWYLMVLGQ